MATTIAPPAPSEARSEADVRRQRWAVEQEELTVEMAALTRTFSQPPASELDAPSSPASSRVSEEEERFQASEGRQAAEGRMTWDRWDATLTLQAAARGWAVRRSKRGRPTKLGTPLAHPMTKLVVPASRYFTLPGGNRKAAAGGRKPRHASPAVSRTGMAHMTTSATGGSGGRALPKSASAAGLSSQKHAREAVDAQLQAELERSRQRQVQSILLTTFDR